MKKIAGPLLNILIVFSFFVLLNACKKEKEEPEKTNYIAAKVNGALWTPSSIQCILFENDSLNFRIVSITATYGGKTITIEADDHGSGTTVNTGTRTYAEGSAFFGYSTSNNTPYMTSSGSINITFNDPAAQLLSGTFNFSTVDHDGNIVQVTDGDFQKVSFSRKVQ